MCRRPPAQPREAWLWLALFFTCLSGVATLGSPAGPAVACNPKDSPVDCAFIADAVAAWGQNAPLEWRDNATREIKTLCSLPTISCANNVNVSKM